MLTRSQALELLYEHTQNPNLRRHALAVEAAMRRYARLFGGDEELWGIVGLLHDFDYEAHPDEHPNWGLRYLRERNLLPEEALEAIAGHAAERTGVERRTPMAHALFAVDELTGFIVAVALVRPDKKLASVKVKSVKKKMKDKSFARQVSREDLRKGAEEVGLSFEEHVGHVLAAMQEIADELGL